MIELIELLENTAMPAEERIALATKLAKAEFGMDLSLAMSLAGKPPTRASILNHLEILADDARHIEDLNLEFDIRRLLRDGEPRSRSTWMADLSRD